MISLTEILDVDGDGQLTLADAGMAAVEAAAEVAGDGGMLGGAAAGARIGSTAGPWGAAAGGVLGGIAGAVLDGYIDEALDGDTSATQPQDWIAGTTSAEEWGQQQAGGGAGRPPSNGGFGQPPSGGGGYGGSRSGAPPPGFNPMAIRPTTFVRDSTLDAYCDAVRYHWQLAQSVNSGFTKMGEALEQMWTDFGRASQAQTEATGRQSGTNPTLFFGVDATDYPYDKNQGFLLDFVRGLVSRLQSDADAYQLLAAFTAVHRYKTGK